MTNTQTYPTMDTMNDLVGIQEAAKALGVSAKTLRRWEAQGKISSERTAGNQRRYDIQKLKGEVAAVVAKSDESQIGGG